MPRYPKPPPIILTVQDVATGRDTRMVDDITGEAIPQPKAKPVPSIDELKAKAQRHKKARADAICALLHATPVQIEHKPFKRRF